MEHIVLQCLVFITFQSDVNAQYLFKYAEDRYICEKTEFVSISPLRVVSMTQMAWQSAHACCKMKGRLLHTVEKSIESEEYPLQKMLPEKMGEEAEDLQFWIGLSYRKENFQWSFGSVLPPDHLKISQEMYKWVDGHPEISPTTRCAAISPFRNILELRTASCNIKLHFICQKVLRIGGKPLSGFDMMEVGSAKFTDVPGFKNLKLSTTYVRWPVANAICQSRKWALISRVHEQYGDKLAKSIGIRIKDYNGSRAIHTSGNDFCESHDWQWTCGEKLIGNIPWFQNVTFQLPGKSDDNKHCLQYAVQRLSDSANFTWITSNVECNEFGYTICDTAPSCFYADQHRCLHKDPHFIDIESAIKSEKEDCKRSEFQELQTLEKGNGNSYWVSLSSKFTWLGAKTCCNSRGWHLPAPTTARELEVPMYTNSSHNNLLAAIFDLCKNEKKCDGFWTSTSNLGYLPHSPLRYPTGKLLSKNLYSLLRADAFSYPSCGRINFVDFQRSHAKYVHADCLERNVLLCEESSEEEHDIFKRKVIDELNEIDEFEQSSFDEFFEPPTEEDLQRRSRNNGRDICLGADIHKQYTENCPSSATTVDPAQDVPQLDGPTIKEKVAIAFQNKKILLEQLVEKAFYSQEIEETYAFQFLNSSIILFSELCPIIPLKFLANSFQLFQRLHLILNPKQKPEIMTQVNFDWTMRLLSMCRDQLKPVSIKHDNCGDLVLAEKNCGDFICTDTKFEFNLYKRDPLLDIMWKVFEAIHAACFPAFKQNPMLHHKYAMAITDLWDSKDIRVRWSHQIENKDYWKRLLGPNFEEHLLNLERCNTVTIENSYFRVRLPKSSLPYSVRMTGFSYETL